MTSNGSEPSECTRGSGLARRGVLCYTGRMHTANALFTPFVAILATISLGAEPSTLPEIDPGKPIDGVAAEVNGEAITMQEVLEEVRSRILQNRSEKDPLPSAAEMQALYEQALDEAIRRRLVLREFTDAGMQLPDWVVEKRVSEILDGRFGGDLTKLGEELARRHITTAEWRAELEESTKLMAMRQFNVDKNVHIGPAAILDYYREHEKEFVREAGVRVSLIFLKRKPGETPEQLEERAKTLRARLDREPFSEIARYFSDDPSASRGGDWGWLKPEETLREELAASLATLAVGETGPLVPTSSGIYILRKTGERQDGLQPIDSVRDEIDATLRRIESERLFREWTDFLRAKAQVRILIPTLL